MEATTTKPADFLFEVSWEVCNKLGGIHTVIATKAQSVLNTWGQQNYIAIGPDIAGREDNPEFEEDNSLLSSWKQAAYHEGLNIRIGRWRIIGSPIVVLVNYSGLISHKDNLLHRLWSDFGVNSLSGNWDYIEPLLFGLAAGATIESYKRNNLHTGANVMAHFHEWMSASGVLYMRKKAPEITTVFTTHATVVGRCIAGNGLELYSKLGSYNADQVAEQYGVAAKHSLERAAAMNCDCFTTVSQITALECEYLLGVKVGKITPNGFENNFVFTAESKDLKRKEARELLKLAARATLGIDYNKAHKEPLIIGISGRYEFRNKGIDIYIDALANLTHSADLDQDILAYIMVPMDSSSAREDVRTRMNLNSPIERSYTTDSIANTTHYINDPNNNKIIERLKLYKLDGASDDRRVQIIIVPCYLNGNDGIFNKTYYELLCGFDLTVFPSYYEPWGYTPLESIAFGVPTVTTTLAGFGTWAKFKAESMPESSISGVSVVERTDSNQPQVTEHIADILILHSQLNKYQRVEASDSATKLSLQALWSNMYEQYINAYTKALESNDIRSKKQSNTDGNKSNNGGDAQNQINFLRQQLMPVNKPNWNRLIVDRSTPIELEKLSTLSRNIWWSWNRSSRSLFEHIDRDKWNHLEQNPIALLDNLSNTQLKTLSSDNGFIDRMNRVYAEFEAYMSHKQDTLKPDTTGQNPLIAYFSMEYGLHSSLKIYSGGLGILAGDYLKESSDKNVRMVAVGLLYRYGYFTQRLSHAGDQEAGYEAQNFDKLPITPMRDENGSWYTVSLSMPGRRITARIWKCEVGRTELYLLDTDHEMNLEEDRSITHHLYGGDLENRLKQEMLLGIGGVRALKALGFKPDLYHCNEGHAAMLGLERLNNYINEQDLSFSEALELVRSSSLFTTHTPVPAGHDAFTEDMLRQYMGHYPDRLKITWDQLLNLGKTNPEDHNEKLSMSVLAANLSQEVNGVSWLHSEVSKDIFAPMWPGYLPCEAHIGYVTNGVHFPSWASSRIKELYYKYFGEEFRNGNYSKELWNKAYEIPDKELWDTRLYLKNKLLRLVRNRMADPTQFSYDSPRQLIIMQENIKKEVLTIGFARRFATYKRAHLLFTNLERLSSIVNNPECPVQFIFAGKAHPADRAGQDLIKRIVEVSKMPQFIGKIIFLQNYDMELARRMVQGVDIWLNTPTRPMEASGTSGEKAVMNGVMHFSVLDGWWVEGYKKGAGWMLPMERTFADQRYQDELDSEMVYTILEDQIVPMYYSRNNDNIPEKWTQSIKNSIALVASNFTTNRMMQDYQDRFYSKLYKRNQKLRANNDELARNIAAWKRRVSQDWDNVKVISTKQHDISKLAILSGQSYSFEVTLDIDKLTPEDIGVELLIADQIIDPNKVKLNSVYQFQIDQIQGNTVTYKLDVEPDMNGSFDTAIRIYAKNENLAHRMDFALVKWA